MKTDTIIISDLHIGNPLSKIQLLLKVLSEWDFKTLIILGDLVSSPKLNHLSKTEWQFLKKLSSLVDCGKNIIFVEGNHDIGISEILGIMMGIPVVQKWQWEINGKKYLAVHGHEFDQISSGIFGKFLSWLYMCILRIHFIRKYFGVPLSEISRNWQRITKTVAIEAIKLAKKLDCDIVFCGHTHEAYYKKSGSIEYHNTGSWVERECTLISIDYSGNLKINKY